ncbi:MAG: FAD:protein FMN transferase [Candidatus Wallbacteria bacterium]|nr:FAD:protein FMN transferase [Candidatus Wallbacteria bacterium]
MRVFILLVLGWMAASGCAAAEHRVTESRQAMGTLLEITAVAPTVARAHAALEAAFAEVDRLDGVLSNWRDSTELSRFNAAAGSGSVAISKDLECVFRQALEVFRGSAGAFDITLGAEILAQRRSAEQYLVVKPVASTCTGFFRKPGTGRRHGLPGRDALPPRLRVGPGRAALAAAGMAIDLGGIGKGYAVDRAREAMLQAGALAGFIDFGRSSIAGFGPQTWRVQARKLNGEPGEPIELRDASLSTSEAGGEGGAILDARTALPVPFARLATVRASSGAMADAWSTALVVLGRRGLARLSDSGLPHSAWLEDSAGLVRQDSAPAP